ncbi:hypothetical protein GZL_00537 [Streptomyces sp. 769]|nr:hypothetical protein GZL_00537 [Streptomyces sp. 769]
MYDQGPTYPRRRALRPARRPARCAARRAEAGDRGSGEQEAVLLACGGPTPFGPALYRAAGVPTDVK